MTQNGNDHASDNLAMGITSLLSARLLQQQGPPAMGTERAVSAPESAYLVVKRGPVVGLRLLLDRAVNRAGRHPDSHIFLDEASVSRRHAEFRLRNGKFHVVDLGSLNGTYVNGKPVDSAVLADGDEVRIGKFRMTYCAAATTDAE